MEIEGARQEFLVEQLVTNCLILWTIGKFLTLRDLISCSEVSTTWCVKFREFIHAKKKCSIRLIWFDNPCRQLQRLNNLLVESNFLLPFNGIFYIEWETHESIFSTFNDRNHDCLVSGRYDTLLSKVRFTSFVICWPCDRPPETLCPAMRCMERIMIVNAAELKTLTIFQSMYTESLLDYYNVDAKIRPRWLAKLRTFNNGGFVRRSAHCLFKNHIQEILESAPNLIEINGLLPRTMFNEVCDSSCKYSGIIPKDKYRCIRSVHGCDASQLLRLAEGKPQLKYYSSCSLLSFDASQTETFKTEANRSRDVQAVNSLFLSSKNSLRIIHCYISDLVIISREVDKGCWPLLNLFTLELYVRPQDLLSLKYMDLNCMFPRLAEICLKLRTWSRKGHTALLGYASHFKYTDSTVNSLHIESGYIPEEYLRVLELVLPNLTHFTYHHSKCVPEMCAALWKMNWEKMTTIYFCSLQVNVDIDNIFFGLPQEEREFIESQGLDLEKFHHVSSKHSAFNFGSLKTIQLELEEFPHFTHYRDTYKQKQTFPVFSSLIARKISRQFSGLDVEITIEPQYVSPGATICHDACNPTVSCENTPDFTDPRATINTWIHTVPFCCRS